MLTLLLKGVKITKFFLIEDFFHLPPVSTTLMVEGTQGPGGIWFMKKPEVENLVAVALYR
jgi:hypothetical protein